MKNPKNSTPSAATSASASAASPTPAPRTGLQTAALGILHVGTAGWIGYGALMKALEFNPNLLPGPILSLLQWVMKSTSVDPDLLMTWSLRTIIGAEVFIALAILLSTRYARILAILTLSLFCAILAYAMVTTALKDGIVEALTGGCGCFGEKGLPASVMFSIDAVLLLNALLLVPRARGGSFVPLIATFVIGVVAVFAVREPEVVAPTPSPDGAQTATEAPNTPEASGAQTAAATTGKIEGPWPGAPTKYDKNYFPRWKDWIGKPLRDQKLARAIEGPMPADFEKGDWLVVFSRQDCSDCQSMFRAYFAEPRKERVMKVNVPDARGTPLGMPCNGCEERKLFHVRAGETGKSPEYVFRTPVIVRMKDGVVTGVCTDRANADEFNSVFPSQDAGATANPTTTTPTTTTPTTTTPATAPAPQEAVWPGPPTALKSFYVAEFTDAVGKKLSDNPFALLMENKLPANFLKGRWIVIFFREDCDHCFDLLSTHFTGKLKYPTLTVAIPDADPNNLLGNPCDECAKVSLIKGPNYVIATPVVLAINDGVVECVVENVDDMAALEACLKFNQ
jgi:hypothetical protein